MTFLEILAWSSIAATVAWGLTLRRAAAALARLRTAFQTELHYWQAEATRAKERAAQLAREAETWSAGCRQGREDMLTMVPMIVEAHERLTVADRTVPDETHNI